MFTGLASYGNVVDRASVPVCVQAAEGLVLREAEGYAADFLRGEVVVRYVQVEQPTRFSATRQNRKVLKNVACKCAAFAVCVCAFVHV